MMRSKSARLLAAVATVLGAAALGLGRYVLTPGGDTVPPNVAVAVFSYVVATDGTGQPLLTATGSRLERSYGPDVFGRPGPWQVTLFDARGAPIASFGVRDPRLIELQGNPAREIPASYVTRPAPVTWNLVVPLYHGDQRLPVTAIEIRAGDQVLSRWGAVLAGGSYAAGGQLQGFTSLPP